MNVWEFLYDIAGNCTHFYSSCLSTLAQMLKVFIINYCLIFTSTVKAKPEGDGRSSSTLVPRKTLRPKTATRSRDRLQVDAEALEQEDYTDWQSESFCLRVLCEHEEVSRQVYYRKIPKYSDTRNIAVIILKFEQGGFTVE